jgi:hypothetical protein
MVLAVEHPCETWGVVGEAANSVPGVLREHRVGVQLRPRNRHHDEVGGARLLERPGIAEPAVPDQILSPLGFGGELFGRCRSVTWPSRSPSPILEVLPPGAGLACPAEPPSLFSGPSVINSTHIAGCPTLTTTSGAERRR